MRSSFARAGTALLVFLALASVPAFAQAAGQMQGGRMMMGQGQGMMMQDPLNLSPEQVARLRDLNLDYRRDVIPVQSRLQIARLELQGLVTGESSQDKIEAIIRDIAGHQADLLRLSVEHRRNVRNVLTDEQKAVFDRMGFGRGMGGGGCPGMGMGMGRGMGGRMGMGMGMGMMGGAGMMGGGRGMNRFACPFRMR